MKKTRAVAAYAVLFLSIILPMNGRATGPLDQSAQPLLGDNLYVYGSNTLWLQLTCVTNNAASFAIYVPGTVTNNIVNLFFTTNFGAAATWSRVMRCEPGPTNLVVTNLPSAQGFFMLGSPIRPGFDQQFLDRNDDGSTPLVPLNFTINFLNTSASGLYVNNNGNVTFDKQLSTYSPVGLAAAGVKIIAPFWADVDTRNPPSDVVKYGTNVVNGRSAFGVDWVNVGYYAYHADELLSCQMVIIDRSDTAPGNFDLEFNYDRAEWQWGDVSPNDPPRAGFSDGIMNYELSGSGVNGAFMDTNTVSGLVYHSLKTPVLGRYIFLFRNGQPLP